MEIFAWIGEDETGDYGIKSLLVPGLGVTNAVGARRTTMELAPIQQQIQHIANQLNKPMRLVRFVEAETVKTFTPQQRG